MKFQLIIFQTLIVFFITPLISLSQTAGKVKVNRFTFSSQEAEGVLQISQIIWYKGQQSIQEVPSLIMNTDSTGTHTTVDIKYYLFIDADLRRFYYFNKFSNIAKMKMRYRGYCPVDKFGGWDMYSNVPGFEYENSTRLNDTVISGNQYQRYFVDEQSSENSKHYVLYTQKEKYKIPIRLLHSFSEKIESSVVRMDTYYNNQLVGFTQIEYMADSLTTDEDLLFSTWNKRLRLHKYR